VDATDPRPTSANRILETALELFSERGYDGTSVREICEAAHITKPTLYYFYGNKDGVFRALVLGALEEVRHEVELGLAASGPLVERLKLITRGFFVRINAQPKLWRFIQASLWMPSLAQVDDMHHIYVDMCQRIASAMQQAEAAGELQPGPAATRMLVLTGGISEALCNFLIFGAPALTPELADELIDCVVNGWLPRPTP